MEKPSVKRFRLKFRMSSVIIAERLGVDHGNNGVVGVFSDKDIQVGSMVDDEMFTLAIGRTDLHEKARVFADEIGES